MGRIGDESRPPAPRGWPPGARPSLRRRAWGGGGGKNPTQKNTSPPGSGWVGVATVVRPPRETLRRSRGDGAGILRPASGACGLSPWCRRMESGRVDLGPPSPPPRPHRLAAGASRRCPGSPHCPGHRLEPARKARTGQNPSPRKKKAAPPSGWLRSLCQAPTSRSSYPSWSTSPRPVTPSEVPT